MERNFLASFGHNFPIPVHIVVCFSVVANKYSPLTLRQVMTPYDPLGGPTLTDEELEKTFPLGKIPYDYLHISQNIKVVIMPADGTEFFDFLWT